MAIGRPAMRYRSVIVSDEATALPDVPISVRYALLTVEDAEIRLRWDGTHPTALEGHLVAAGDAIELDHRRDVQRLRAIKTGDDDAKIRITYYR
jgi:hypothetical protein